MANNIAEYILDGIKKWGLFVFICVVIWMSVKKAFDWCVMPFFLWCLLKILATIFVWSFVDQLNMGYLMGAWIFVAILGKRMFNACFEVK